MPTPTDQPNVLLFELCCIAIFCFYSFPMVIFSRLSQSNRWLTINPCTKIKVRDFPGGLVVGTSSSHAGGPSLVLGWGTGSPCLNCKFICFTKLLIIPHGSTETLAQSEREKENKCLQPERMWPGWCDRRLYERTTMQKHSVTDGWHHWPDGHVSEQTPGDRKAQGSLVGCGLWGHKESDPTERLHNNWWMGIWLVSRNRVLWTVLYASVLASSTPFLTSLSPFVFSGCCCGD